MIKQQSPVSYYDTFAVKMAKSVVSLPGIMETALESGELWLLYRVKVLIMAHIITFHVGRSKNMEGC